MCGERWKFPLKQDVEKNQNSRKHYPPIQFLLLLNLHFQFCFSRAQLFILHAVLCVCVEGKIQAVYITSMYHLYILCSKTLKLVLDVAIFVTQCKKYTFILCNLTFFSQTREVSDCHIADSDTCAAEYETLLCLGSHRYLIDFVQCRL